MIPIFTPFLRLLFAIAVCFISFVQASPIDSLQRMIHSSAHDTLKVGWLRQLAIEYHETGKQDSALQSIRSCIAMGRKAGFPKGAMQGYSFLGHLQMYLNNDTGAFEAFRQGLEVAVANPKEGRAAASIYLTACTFFSVNGQQKRGLEYGYRALTYYRSVGDTLSAMKAVNNLGFAFAQSSLPDSAVVYSKQYLSFALRRGNERDILRGYLTLGNRFLDIKALDSAMYYLQKALVLTRKLNKKEDEVRTIDAIGEILMRKKQYAEARNLLLGILPTATAISKNDEIAVLCNLADNELADKKYENAIFYAQQVYDYGSGGNKRHTRSRSASILAKAYEAIGKYKEALLAQREWMYTKDTISSDKIEDALATMRTNFEISTQQDKITSLERETAAEKKAARVTMWLMIVLGLALIGAAFAAVMFYRGAKKRQRLNDALEVQKNKLEVANITKDRLFSVVSHDLRGPLTSAYSGMQLLQNDKFPAENRPKLLEASTSRLQTTLTLLDSLLQWSAAQFNQTRIQTIDFSLREATLEAKSAVRDAAEQKNIALLEAIPADTHLHADYPSIVTVIRNLLSNAVKFTPTGGSITVGVQTSDATSVEWFVRDTGVGMSPEQLAKLWALPTSTRGTGGEPGTGIGLSLCKSLVESNGGTIRTESEQGVGTTFIVRMPSKHTA